ncbi:MAG: IS110 family transposase [Candidatus Omnitrophota bacterium]
MRKRNSKIQRESSGASPSLQSINPDAAGIDVGATMLWVAAPEDRDENPIQCFETFTGDLHRLAEWLKQCRIRIVAMESTGVYWIPVYQILESHGLEVKLVNAHHVKNVPGRKTDVKDCRWLQQLHSYGLLSGSFRPKNEICELRGYLRHRETLVKTASAEIQHMQKALVQMNLRLANVISDITGTTGMAIIRAILSGERDPKALARLRHRRIEKSEEEIAKSLEGDFREEHLFCLRQALELYEFCQRQIEACDQKIEECLSRFASKEDGEAKPLPPRKDGKKRSRRGKGAGAKLREELYRISGVDLTQVDGIQELSAQVIISEVGLDMSRFPTEKHFASYLGLCPNHRISGGKILKRSTRKVFNRAAQTLRMAAMIVERTPSALGTYCRRLKSRLGPAKAITATARKLACLIYRMLRFGKEYVDQGQEDYDKQYQQKVLKNIKKRAAQLGYQLTPKQTLTEIVS